MPFARSGCTLQASTARHAERSAAATKAYGKLPLVFEPNVGQMSSDVKFLAHAGGATVLLGPSGALLSIPEAGKGKATPEPNVPLETSFSGRERVSPR